MIKNSTTYTEGTPTKQLAIADLKVFEEIYRTHWKSLFDHAYYRIRSVEKTEEIIQDLFTDLWEKREKIEIRESVTAYLFTALKFRVLNALRNEIIRSGHLNIIKLNTPVSANSIDEEIGYRELEESLEREINNLPEKCREVFILSRKHQLSFKEISEQLGISVNTVEKHIGKALKLLRERLKDLASILILLEILK